MLPSFSYVRPGTLQDAVKQAASTGAGVLAGGTDLLGCMRDGILPLTKLVSMSGVKDLRGIGKRSDEGLTIGSLTTITEVAESTVVRKNYPALSMAASEVASPQLRNQGTIGGNLCQKPRCWYYRGDFLCLRKGGDRCIAVAGENPYHCIFGGGPCFIVHPSDIAPALVAFGASVRTAGPRGERTIPVEKFHVPPSVDVRKDTVLEPGEIVTSIELPPAPKSAKSLYRKVRARNSWDFALAGAAIVVTMNDRTVTSASIVLSGAAPVPWRSKDAEGAITGKRLDEKVIAQAADAVVRNAMPLAQNGYKVHLFRGVMREELKKLAGA
jgi:xanthine dehydrogenase YagS FAD-binding subunit